MELMGVGIVVLILILGAVVFSAYSFSRPKGDLKEDFSKSQMSTNLVNTLLEVNVADCKSVSVNDLVKDMTSDSPKIICDDGLSSAQKFEEVAREVLSYSFEQKKINYEFKLFSTQKTWLLIGECKSVVSPSFFPLPYNSVQIMLAVC